MEKKRKAKLITTLSLTVIVLAIMTTSAAAYAIDGDLSDWGVDLTGDWSLNETWLPNTGVEFIVEDNVDPQWTGYAYGVHIKGYTPTYPSYEPYSEPKVKIPPPYNVWVAEPYGGEKYDIEAKYFDQDSNYIYIAIVTSVPPDAEGVDAPGDLGLDLDADLNTGEWGYEYGVKLGTKTDLTQWDIGYLPDWEKGYVIPENSPGVFKGYEPGGSYKGMATGKYVQNTTCNVGTGLDQGKPNYVIEMAIPKTAVGVTGPLTEGMIHLCDACGNDKIDNPIPEFLTIAIPVGAILGLIYVHRRKRQGKGREE